jgi:hypothetical protein
VLKVMKSLKAEDADFAKNLVEWSDMIRKCYAEDAVDEIITTRRLVNIATAFSIFKDRMKALELATARFDTTTREAFLSMYGKIDATVRPEEDPAEPEIIFEDGSNLPGATLIYLDCPFGEKDQVKVLGGMWDQAAKKWVVAIEVIRLNPDRFSKWTQRYHDENNVAHIIRTA